MKKRAQRIAALSMSAMLAASMAFPAMAATKNPDISDREMKNAEISMNLATQGMVLLENENQALPIAKGGNIALFGGGAYNTVSGGTGSGDVNERSVVSVWGGFVNAGYTVTSEDWLLGYKDAYKKVEDELANQGPVMGPFAPIPELPDYALTDDDIAKAKAGGTEVGIYVITRNAGEFADRVEEKGDYYLTDIEKENIKKVAANFDKSIVLLNTGGIMDTKFFDETEGLDAMLLMSQAGMRSGDAVVKVLNGEVTPSGKLTDTWAVDYDDYSSSENFGNNDGNNTVEEYSDDIYVGYRYFDTFNVTPAYEFGYGKSYTTFDTKVDSVTADASKVTVKATVTNTGKTYAGKEVVQVYFSAPDGQLEKPYQELAAYGKTDELAPGESQTLTLTYNTTDMSAYSDEAEAYIMEAGDYVVRVGNSSRKTNVGAVVRLDKTCTTEQLSSQRPLERDLEILSKEGVPSYSYEGEAAELAAADVIALAADSITTVNHASKYDDESITSYVFEGSDYEAVDQEAHPRYTKEPDGQANTTPSHKHNTYEEEVKVLEKTVENPTLLDVYQGKVGMEEFVAGMSVEEMANLAEGIGMGGTPGETFIGAQANSVKGAAGETTSKYYEKYAIPNIVLADGPAGLRVEKEYEENGENWYQYCTAFPIGTLLAQAWDTQVMEDFGTAVGEEMKEMGATMLLGPGMNIHRNPLCGRNFEYYSEDPLVTGMSAAAETIGLQSHGGVGVTLKHYAANNQEENRNAVNNIISERAFREIYLKGFEIAVKTANPMGIMTSYNLNNGMPAADDYDLCTDFARGEWGFDGLVMTDWGGGQSIPANSMHAGNDLIMPGGSPDDIRMALEDVAPAAAGDGYVQITRGWGGETEKWNDLVLAKDGTVTVDLPVAEGTELNERVAAKVEEGVATINYAEDGTTPVSVTYTGEYADNNNLPLGDLQKSARNILNVIMDSTQFVKMGDEHGIDVEIGKFAKNAGLASVAGVEKSEVAASDKPSTDGPTTDKPSTDKPTTDKPSTDKPATPDKPSTPSTSNKPSTPKTGDVMNITWSLTGMAAAIAAGSKAFSKKRK